jgi:hypothetical protein
MPGWVLGAADPIDVAPRTGQRHDEAAVTRTAQDRHMTAAVDNSLQGRFQTSVFLRTQATARRAYRLDLSSPRRRRQASLGAPNGGSARAYLTDSTRRQRSGHHGSPRHGSERALDIYADRRVPGLRAHAAERAMSCLPRKRPARKMCAWSAGGSVGAGVGPGPEPRSATRARTGNSRHRSSSACPPRERRRQCPGPGSSRGFWCAAVACLIARWLLDIAPPHWLEYGRAH